MDPVDIVQLAAWAGGDVVGKRDVVLASISTDSRTLKAGACFVALMGERFDGHDFLRDAFRRGAGAAVVAREKKPVWDEFAGRLPLVTVDETTRALQRIAHGYRRRFRVPVIGITGSNGKTTTKDMVAAILGTLGPVAATEKNLNNQIGLPLTLLQVESRHHAVVIEMGMSKRGEIARLAEIAEPAVGVVTNVGPVHLEFLGSIEEVAAAKAELVEALPSGGCAVLNADDPRVMAMADRTAARTITFGLDSRADVRAVDVTMRGVDGSRFTLVSQGGGAALGGGAIERGAIEVTLPIPGRHHVINALAAAGAALAAGADLEMVRRGLAGVRITGMRMEVIRLDAGVTVINDAYNASPLSTRAALETLAELAGDRKVAVLGDMLELGSEAGPAHDAVGRLAHALGVDLLVGVGPLSRRTVGRAAEAGLDASSIRWYPDAAEAAACAGEWIHPGDVVLVKGSRGVRLEQVVEAITNRLGGGAVRAHPPLSEEERR